MSRKITISDIAKKLNVSESLVSFVLNGKAKEMRISEKMQKKVLETAKELHYKPSFLAKSFRTGKSNTIGLIVADISNSFFSKLAGFIEKETEKSNYNLIFMSSDENKVIAVNDTPETKKVEVSVKDADTGKVLLQQYIVLETELVLRESCP